MVSTTSANTRKKPLPRPKTSVIRDPLPLAGEGGGGPRYSPLVGPQAKT